jgi:hypothetical protein
MLWGSSRDRNIFARGYDPGHHEWDAAREISPHAPEVEDHTDPDVVIDTQGRNWVVWKYEKAAAIGSEIVLRGLTRELQVAGK